MRHAIAVRGLSRYRIVIWLLLALQASRAADDVVCATCHSAIYESYETTPMARSSGVVDRAHAAAVRSGEFSAPGGAQYDMTADASGIVVRIREGSREAVHSLAYFVGAGVTGRSYLYDAGGYLFQSPVAFYTATRKWDLSPGFESTKAVVLTRAVEEGCLSCHATRLRPIANSTNGYLQPAFERGGVGCERCHGPGDEHVMRMRKRNFTGELAIVNPAKLDQGRRDSVCEQCHLVGAIRVAKVSASSYAPGQPLFDSTAAFLWANRQRFLPANSHVEQLTRSECWQRSHGRLWCGTCHNPHRVVTSAQRSGYYRARCQGCHGNSAPSCGASMPARKKVGDDCIACHMPAMPITTVQHAVQTDHGIPRVPGLLEGSTEVPADAELAAFPGSAPGDRELGLAYASEAIRSNRREWGLRAYELLRAVYAAQPDDKAVADQLAQLLDRMGREGEACNLFVRAAAGDAATGALVNAGVCRAKEGRVAEAMDLWKRAVGKNPGLEAARLNLAVAQYRNGDAAGARMTIQQGLRLDPFWERAQELFSEMR